MKQFIGVFFIFFVLLLASCSQVQSQKENSSNVNFKFGTTTEADIQSLIGRPDEIKKLGDEKIYVYNGIAMAGVNCREKIINKNYKSIFVFDDLIENKLVMVGYALDTKDIKDFNRCEVPFKNMDKIIKSIWRYKHA